MGNVKYRQQQVVEIFKDHGLILNDIYRDNKTTLHCIDQYGYEYAVRLGDLLKGKKCSKIHRGNPYSINNIKRYLKQDNSKLRVLEDNYVNAKTSMLFQCECGSIFNSNWNSILHGKRYCNFCAKSKRFDGYRDYTKEIKDYCELMGYTLLTLHIHRCHDKFEYVCNKHKDKGTQYSSYDQMINGHRGCLYCGIQSRGISHRSDENKFKKEVERVGFLYVGYDYDNDSSKYKKANIHYICPNHINKGIQTIKYNNLIKSNGKCKYCIGHGRTKEDLQLELDNMHGSINILEYSDYGSPILVKCRICNHMWISSGISLTQGHRCPHCSKSNFELEVSNLLDKWGYKHEDEYWYSDCRDKLPLPFDFYLGDFNVLIEADGEHHYIPIQRGSKIQDNAMSNYEITKRHDEIKTKYCVKNNIPLIRIPYWERDDLECFLWDKFIQLGILKEIAV